MDSRRNQMNFQVLGWNPSPRLPPRSWSICKKKKKKRSGSRNGSQSTTTVDYTSVRRHVQETFGGIQDIRYDSKPLLLALVSESILAPLRSSDRKKLRQRLTQEFSLSQEIGELLVPEGLLSVKYTSHSRVPGVCGFRAISFDLFYSTRLGGLPLIGWRPAVVHDGERV